MKCEWKECNLGDLVTFQRGYDLPKTKMKKGKYPVVGSNGIIGYHNDYTTENPSITIGRSGNVGNPTIIYSRTWAHNTTLYIKEYKNCCPVFIYYFLKTLNLSNYAGGSAVPTLNRNHIHSLQVKVPLLYDVQAKIGSFLKLLDDKIELNNAINHNLQQQIQSLYDSWFKRFEPFKSSMQDSELGSIPSNWQVKDIYSIASIIYGAPFSSKLFNTERNGKPIVRIRDLKSQETNTYTTECHPKGYLLKNGDIVVGMDGEFRPYIWGSDQAWLNQRVCVFVNKRPHGKAFLLYSIKPLLNIVEQTEAATTVIHIGKQDFDAFRIVLPPDKILNAFDEITAPMYDQIVNNICENRRLGILRDTLLPKLMSGEIDISEVEI